MILRIPLLLILVSVMAAMMGVRAEAQAVINAAQSQFGTEPTPYASPAQGTQDQTSPVAQPAYSTGAPASGYPGAYAPQPETGVLGAPDPSKPLGRGDVVTFSIAQDREAPTVMRVTDTGELDFSTFPKIGRISVVGRNCAEISDELKHKLEADYYYKADVTLGINQVNHLDSRGKVYISGNVRGPGAQDLPSSEHTMVSTAIIRAGGFDKFADTHKVQVTRKDKSGNAQRFTIDVGAVINKGRMEKDMELQDGDYINVPQKLINF
jgi:protein involved in polysaccharide export with SLBB domain